jgi:hypothetical protein
MREFDPKIPHKNAKKSSFSSPTEPWTSAIEFEYSCSVHPWNTGSILEFWKMIAHIAFLHDIFVSDNPKLWKKIKRKCGSRQ